MKVLIINLKTSTQRLQFQTEQFSQLHMSFEILPAVSIDDISEDDYQKQGFGWQRPLRKVELACFLSHKNAWEKVAQANEPYLILEDDAILAKNSNQILSAIQNNTICNTIDLINLEVRSRKKIINKSPKIELLDGRFKLYELYQDRTGAAGYILYPSGANKLLTKLQHTAPALADAFICASYELNSLQIEPALIIQQDQMLNYGLVEKTHFDSTIGRSEHHKTVYNNILQKIQFKTRRIIAQLKMAYRHLQVLNKSKKRFIQFNKDIFLEHL